MIQNLVGICSRIKKWFVSQGTLPINQSDIEQQTTFAKKFEAPNFLKFIAILA